MFILYSILIILIVIGLYHFGMKLLHWIATGEDDKPIKQNDEYVSEGTRLNMSCLEYMQYVNKGKTAAEGNTPLEVVIKEAGLDTSKLLDYVGEEKKVFNFRPQNFDEFVGQDDNKDRIKMAIKRIDMGMKVHFFFDALPGRGKTTMARIINNMIDGEFIERIGKQITPESLIDIMNHFNKSSKKYCILFIDEIDTLTHATCKVLNPLLEDFAIAGKKVKPFIFIGATIDKNELVKRGNGDMLDRISDHIYFENYNSNNIEKILLQYHKQIYSHHNITAEDITVIAQNCKESPRLSITMLEYYLAANDVQKVLGYFKIIQDGLTKIDISILQALKNRYPKTLGASALSQKAGINQKDYIEIYESYLVEKGYIDRLPMRKISDKGIELLNKLEVKNEGANLYSIKKW